MNKRNTFPRLLALKVGCFPGPRFKTRNEIRAYLSEPSIPMFWEARIEKNEWGCSCSCLLRLGS